MKYFKWSKISRLTIIGTEVNLNVSAQGKQLKQPYLDEPVKRNNADLTFFHSDESC